jgi:methanogenic corrinoid protein MtbC1
LENGGAWKSAFKAAGQRLERRNHVADLRSAAMFRKTRIEGGVFHVLRENRSPEMAPRFVPSPRVSAPDLTSSRSPWPQIVAHQIVPKLKWVHHDLKRSVARTRPDRGAIAEFCALATGTDATAAVAYFEKMRAQGHTFETLFVDLLEPAARQLGRMWDKDRCDFIDVTLGISRMREILARYGSVAANAPARDARYNALLLSLPDENHTFGIDMVAAAMRGAGWEVKVALGLPADRCAAVVAHEWIGVVGITLGVEAGLGAVARAITGMRRASLNPKLSIMVGGAAFAARPDRVIEVGAEAAASDAPTAAALAQKLLMA